MVVLPVHLYTAPLTTFTSVTSSAAPHCPQPAHPGVGQIHLRTPGTPSYRQSLPRALVLSVRLHPGHRTSSA